MFRGPKEDQFDTAKTHVGAANVAAAFCLMQGSSIDKAMYYDACPTRSYCGLFYFPSYRTTPCYEAFRAWNVLAKLGTSVACDVSGKGLYAAAAKGAAGRAFLVSNTGAEAADVRVSGVEGGSFGIYRVDAEHPVLSPAGTWRSGQPLAFPPSGFVLALDGPSLESAGVGAGATAHPANGLQQ